MNTDPIHIVSFDNPYPANYGGAIDVFYKIKALHAIGVIVDLHCFTEEKEVPQALKEICRSVYFYPKRKSILHFLSNVPYRVKIRYHEKMIERILNDKSPILFEGLHTTLMLKDRRLLDRKILVRAHNIEHDYSAGLAQSSKHILWKFIYKLEAYRFKKYERILANVTAIISLSHYEHDYFNKVYKNVVNVPVFHGGSEVKELSGKGKYALYHGDLSISDNIRAVEFLITIFKINKHPFVIASSTRQKCIDDKIRNTVNISYVLIKDEKHLVDLLAGAHINVLYSFQRSGTKLKLINALYQSRFCVINENITDDKSVIKLCKLATTKEAFLQAIEEYQHQDYNEYEKRKKVLPKIYNILENAQKIKNVID